MVWYRIPLPPQYVAHTSPKVRVQYSLTFETPSKWQHFESKLFWGHPTMFVAAYVTKGLAMVSLFVLSCV